MGIFEDTSWTVRRYNLPNYDKRALDSDIQAWVKRQGLSIKPALGWYLDGVTKTFFIPVEARQSGQESLIIRYLAPTLYVYTTSYLPEAVKHIDEAVIATYVAKRGGSPLEEEPYVFTRAKALSPYKEFEKVINGPSAQRPAQAKVRVYVDSEEREPVSCRLIDLPAGAKQTFTRSWTVQRTLSVEWRVAGSAEFSYGIKEVLSASIRGEIERRTGTTYTESTTQTEAIELGGGEGGRKYNLIWKELWIVGHVDIVQGNSETTVPFRFREGAELHSEPIESGTGT